MQATPDLSRLTASERAELVAVLERLAEIRARNRIRNYFPDADIVNAKGEVLFHARAKYQKHLEFFRAGATYRERCFMAANRIGKTEGAGGYECVLHATGDYPHWWDGRVFDTATDGWACGKTNQTTRDIIQFKLFGKVHHNGDFKFVDGTGLVPYERIGRITWNRHFPDFIDTVEVKHACGDWSKIGFKAYEQGRGAFEGTEKHWVWMDEEPPLDVYEECLIRTATTHGLMICTFTPLEGATEVVNSFLPPALMNEIRQQVDRA